MCAIQNQMDFNSGRIVIDQFWFLYIVTCQAHPALVKALVKALRTACVCYKPLVTKQVGGSPLVSGLVHLCTD